MDYSQPDFYKFNSDSLELVKLVKSEALKANNLLDLCAGCGVLGLELMNSIDQLERVEFVELQRLFLEHLTKNIEKFSRKSITTKVRLCSVGELSLEQKYDLIVCNPPYFENGSGRVSPNENRQIARTFMIDSPCVLLEKILNLLSKGAKAYILIPNNDKNWNHLKNEYSLVLKEKLERASIYLLYKGNID